MFPPQCAFELRGHCHRLACRGTCSILALEILVLGVGLLLAVLVVVGLAADRSVEIHTVAIALETNMLAGK